MLKKFFLFLLLAATPALANAAQGLTKAETEALKRSISEGQAAADAKNPNKFRPALGDDEGEPDVNPNWLPPGVRILGPVKGIDAGEGECEDKDMEIGTGRSVMSCIALCIDSADGEWREYFDENGNPTGKFEFVQGLILISEHPDGQNGMLVERTRINMPIPFCRASGGMETDDEDKKQQALIIQLNMYCLNESKSPSFENMDYTMAGVTKDPDLLELLGILDRKQVDSDENGALVQEAIYEITERRGLTPDTRRKLNDLPDRA
ncbi:hypothetical protein IC614_04605 [Allosphingosinicella flava]|uniref:Uncharacterized protein n=1 Tax=Allosphingosinicella flava TaxID=2771430 RepID=A0A7T2LMS9_9SPHN|nr:hypothetical protein [Sphingosinicella flava]QPQ55871.1 hypothetical protein IC614_04605 [Sphingosinicella flava]